MRFTAKALYIPFSPYKLRPLANVLRGKSLVYALGWLRTYKTRRAHPLKKIIESAAANAKNLKSIDRGMLLIKEICVDQGPMHRYFKPGAMGRAMDQQRRLCHISVTLEVQNQSKERQEG